MSNTQNKTATDPAASDKSKTATDPAADAKKKVETARVRSKVGRSVHLHTGQVIDERDVKIEIDGFAQAQLDAGKWEIVED